MLAAQSHIIVGRNSVRFVKIENFRVRMKLQTFISIDNKYLLGD